MESSVIRRAAAELQAAGLTFKHQKRRVDAERALQLVEQGDVVQVKTPDAKYVPVESLADACALSALYALGSMGTVENVGLVAALKHLASHGVRFYVNTDDNKDTPLGLYGTWRTLKDGGPGGKGYAVRLSPMPTSMTDNLYVNHPDDIVNCSFFDFDGPPDGLRYPEAARTMRDLQRYDVQFDTHRDAGQAYEELVKHPNKKLSVRMGSEPIDKVGLAELSNPESFSPDITDAARFYGTALLPRVEADELYDQNAGVQLARMLDDLNGPLAAEAMDEAERLNLRARYVDLACAARDINICRAAWELIRFDTGAEDFDTRMGVMRRLLAMEDSMGRLKDDPEVERGDRPDPPTFRAVDDYKLLLTHRRADQSLAQAETVLKSLVQGMAGREGWGACRDAFIFLQKGGARGMFPGRNADEAVVAFLETYLRTKDVDACRQEVLRTPAPPKNTTVRRNESEVQVGDLTVPRRAYRTKAAAQR